MAMLSGIGRLLRSSAAVRVLTAKNSSLYPTPNTNSLRLAFIPSRGIGTKIFVGGLSFYTTEKALTEAFSRFGEVVEVKIIMDRVSQRSKGFGFVQYASEEEAEKAKTEMNGKILNGRVIFVDAVKPKSELSRDLPRATGPPVLERETTLEGVDEYEKL